jgi:hypothetical protein
MPTLIPSATYYPTHKLTDADRNLPVYTVGRIIGIYKQPHRRQIPRPKDLKKPGLIAQWKQQDQELVQAGGWTAKDYPSVPGKDGIAGQGAMVHETEDQDDIDDDNSDGDNSDGKDDDSNQEGDENKRDQGAEAGDHNGDDDGDERGEDLTNADDEDDQDDLEEVSVTEKVTYGIAMPAKAQMKADLKARGLWAPEGRRNQEPIFRQMWYLEWLGRNNAAAAAARQVLPTSAAQAERDHGEDEGRDQMTKQKQATPATAEHVPRKRKRTETEETRNRKRPKSAEDESAPERDGNDVQEEPGVSRQDGDVRMSGMNNVIAAPVQPAKQFSNVKLAKKRPVTGQSGTTKPKVVKSTPKPKSLITKLQFSKENMDRVIHPTGEPSDKLMADHPDMNVRSEDDVSHKTTSDTEEPTDGIPKSPRRQGSTSNEDDIDPDSISAGTVTPRKTAAKGKGRAVEDPEGGDAAKEQSEEEMVFEWYGTHKVDNWTMPPDPRFDHLIPDDQLIAVELRQRYALKREAARKKAEEEGVPFEEPPPKKKKWRLRDHPRKPGEARRPPRFGRDGELIIRKE